LTSFKSSDTADGVLRSKLRNALGTDGLVMHLQHILPMLEQTGWSYLDLVSTEITESKAVQEGDDVIKTAHFWHHWKTPKMAICNLHQPKNFSCSLVKLLRLRSHISQATLGIGQA